MKPFVTATLAVWALVGTPTLCLANLCSCRAEAGCAGGAGDDDCSADECCPQATQRDASPHGLLALPVIYDPSCPPLYFDVTAWLELPSPERLGKNLPFPSSDIPLRI